MNRAKTVRRLRKIADHLEAETPMTEPLPAARTLDVAIGYAPTSALTDTSGRVPLVHIWRGQIEVDGPRVEIDLRGIGLPPDIAIGVVNLEAHS